MSDNMENPENELEKALLRARRDLAVIYDISNAMRTTLDLEKILYIILTGVTSHSGLGFNRAILFLVNLSSRCLEPKLAIGPDSIEHAQKIWEFINNADQDLEELIEIPTEDITRQVYSSSLFNSIRHMKIPLDPATENLLVDAYHLGLPMHVTEEKLAKYSDDTLLKELKTNELVIMPLKAKDKVNGLIVADNLFTKKPITKDDQRLFMMLANQAGLAIENSQLYEQIMHRSHTDAVTGLWNHGFFQNQLSYEIARQAAGRGPVSLLLIDIDNFKKLNDTFGHQYGDTVLLEIAKILKDSSRENDYVCRYGGEEFALILPQSGIEAAFPSAERIRKNIESCSFSRPPEKTAVPITVSIGLACFPRHALTKADLIQKADKALYISKSGGKNRTSVADNP